MHEPRCRLGARLHPSSARLSLAGVRTLVAQTARHARVAEVADEVVARARLIPEDVRLVTAKVVAGYGVVGGFRRPAEVGVHCYHHPARDGGGAAVSVGDEDAPRAARDVVADNLRVLGFLAYHKSTHNTETAHNVGEHLGPRGVFDVYAEPVAYEVILRDSGIDALVDLDRVVVFRDVSDNILHDRGVAGLALDKDTVGVGFRDAYNIILRDGGIDAPANDDPAGDIACGTVSHDGGVASGENVDRQRILAIPPSFLEASDREATNAHVLYALVDLVRFEVVLEIHVAADANSLRSEKLRAR